MCPKRPCYTCKIDRCLLFDNPELEKEFASVKGMPGESIQGTYKAVKNNC